MSFRRAGLAVILALVTTGAPSKNGTPERAVFARIHNHEITSFRTSPYS